MKAVLTIIFVSIAVSGFSQFDTSRLIWRKNSYGDRVPRIQADMVLSIPQDTIYSKSGIAQKDSTLYVGNGSFWTKVKGDGSVQPSLSATHIETTGTYTVADSVNTVICQYSGGATGINLPDPAASDKRELTIRNVSGNDVTFNYSVKYSSSESSSTLATGKSIRIKSDGTNWNVVQDSGSSSTVINSSGSGVFVTEF